ncbi:MAG: outer membrane beta-barrel protein [Edaphobacter sp.]
MKYKKTLVRSFVFLAVCALSRVALSQASPAGTQHLELSAFAGVTGTFTDLAGGKNLGITAGADLTFLGFRLFRPSLEARGTYPIDKGKISSQKNFLVGPRVEYPIGRLHPYADFLFGRGEIDYKFYIFGNNIFIKTNTFIYSPGVGLDYNLTHNLAANADVQFQHWDTQAVPSGAIHPTAITVGARYTFDFNHGHRHND